MKLTPSYPLSRLKRNLREFETLNGGRRSVACRRFLNRVIVSRNLLQGGETCEEQYRACLAAEQQNEYSDEEEFYSEEVVTKREYPLVKEEVDPAWADPKQLEFFSVNSDYYAQYTKHFFDGYFYSWRKGGLDVFKGRILNHFKSILGRVVGWFRSSTNHGTLDKSTLILIHRYANEVIHNVEYMQSLDKKLGDKLLEKHLIILKDDWRNEEEIFQRYENLARKFRQEEAIVEKEVALSDTDSLVNEKGRAYWGGLSTDQYKKELKRLQDLLETIPGRSTISGSAEAKPVNDALKNLEKSFIMSRFKVDWNDIYQFRKYRNRIVLPQGPYKINGRTWRQIVDKMRSVGFWLDKRKRVG